MAFDAALSLNAGDPEIWFKKGGALMHIGHYEAAVTAFDHAITLRPEDSGPILKGAGHWLH